MVEKFSGMINSIAAGFQKQLEQWGQEKQTDENSGAAVSATKDDDDDANDVEKPLLMIGLISSCADQFRSCALS